MRVLQINTVFPVGSTGKIAAGIQSMCRDKGIECKTAYRYYEDSALPETFTTSSWMDCHVHNRIARYTMLQGWFSRRKTKAFLRKVSEYNPDVIHLHNLHGSYINLKLLFSYIKKHNIPVVWTLHDCWAFTGYCPYFTMVNCEKWRSGCHHCPVAKNDRNIIMDTSRYMYHLKKKCFMGVKNLTIVTPSQWLADLAKESFLKEYPIKVIHNGIDLSVFSPVESDFRAKNNIPANKKILLGVAFDWGKRKGLDIFDELATRLDKDKYQIVMVGTSEDIDRQLPADIITIHRTTNQKELAQIYAAADLLVNPTREDNYPTVNMESVACGTPVLTFRTGGSPEMLDITCGSVVECDDIDALEKEIMRICEEEPFSQEACLKRAKTFDMYERFAEYINLYFSMPS